jgi:hypothetical protein
MNKAVRLLCAVLSMVGLAMPVHAEEGKGWMFSGRFLGSSNSDGLVTKADSTIGYGLNPHVQTYAGIPFYFVNVSSTATQQTTTGFVSGIGNAYIGLRFKIDSDALKFSSTIEGTAPTGDKDKGLSTGRATVDWTNTLSYKINHLTPFGSAGLSNTVSDTAFFVRPFTSLGVVSHFEGGATLGIAPLVRVGASAYAVQASGEQRIFSKLKRTTSGTTGLLQKGNRPFETAAETIGSSNLTDDHGVATWLSIQAGSSADLQLGYTRSMGYDLNTLSFGIGFRLGH